MEPNHKKGLFITLEGCEASGKSTQSILLQQYLDSLSIPYIATKEPGGTELANNIRDLVVNQEIINPLVESFLIAAGRCDHIARIKKHLEIGDFVICDRYIDSSRVYQGIVKNLSDDKLETLISWATDDLQPDITIMLDIEAEEAMNRISRSVSHNSFYDNKGIEFHSAIRKGFIKIAELYKDRIFVLNGARDPKIIHNEIIELIDSKIVAILK